MLMHGCVESGIDRDGEIKRVKGYESLKYVIQFAHT
jgi:hypothetical protein